MKRVRVIPVLLLKNTGLVKTIRFKKPTYIGDPINAVKLFNEKEVDEIILLDINASVQGREPNFGKISEICSEAFMPFAYGGGIKNLDHIKKLFKIGIEKVVLNTQAYFNPKLIEEAAKIFGSQSIVVAIDVKKNWLGIKKAYVKSGTINTKYSPIEFAKKAQDFGAGELIVTSIDHEGTYNGFDLELIKQISGVVNIPVVSNGGASSINDFYLAINSGASAVAAGSLFVYQSNTKGVLINYPSQKELKDILFSKI